MTWQQFTAGLRTVAQTGSTQTIAPEVTHALGKLGAITGSEANDAGVTLTEIGRLWYQRAVVDRENDALVEGMAGLWDVVLGTAPKGEGD